MHSKKIIQCELCPKGCRLKNMQRGDCRIRINVEGVLLATTFGRPVALHVDPIEKKPFFHYFPGSKTLSLATVGCNLHCLNCQNWQISQANPEDERAYQFPPEKLIALAKQKGFASISYTYTEPLVYYEYTYESSQIARSLGIKNILVTAGYLNPKPLRQLYKYIDAETIDIKSFDDNFYRKICQATLKPVLRGLTIAKEEGVWLEVSNLVIPTLNDKRTDFENLCQWIGRTLGNDTPMHFLRFFPRYKMLNLPPTPQETLELAKKIAHDQGLSHVYIGNILKSGGDNTYCPKDQTLLVKRVGYTIVKNIITRDGTCPKCSTKIAGVWR